MNKRHITQKHLPENSPPSLGKRGGKIPLSNSTVVSVRFKAAMQPRTGTAGAASLDRFRPQPAAPSSSGRRRQGNRSSDEQEECNLCPGCHSRFPSGAGAAKLQPHQGGGADVAAAGWKRMKRNGRDPSLSLTTRVRKGWSRGEVKQNKEAAAGS